MQNCLVSRSQHVHGFVTRPWNCNEITFCIVALPSSSCRVPALSINAARLSPLERRPDEIDATSPALPPHDTYQQRRTRRAARLRRRRAEPVRLWLPDARLAKSLLPRRRPLPRPLQDTANLPHVRLLQYTRRASRRRQLYSRHVVHSERGTACGH